MNTRLSAFPYPKRVGQVAQPDWVDGPCSITPKSHSFDWSNWAFAYEEIEKLDPTGETWETLVFPHWGTVYVEVIFVKPGSSVHKLCEFMYTKMTRIGAVDARVWDDFSDKKRTVAVAGGVESNNGAVFEPARAASRTATERHAEYDIGGEG